MKSRRHYGPFLGVLLATASSIQAAEPWQSTLASMPLATNVARLDRSNCVPVVLASFRSNSVARGLIFMPGATDEFYFFRRAAATLTNSQPTLLDAVTALTNQTLIRCTFRSPFVLFYSGEDTLERVNKIEDEPTAARIRKERYPSPILFDDRDWNSLYRPISFRFNTPLQPQPGSHASNHFYRHSLAAFGLSPFEVLEALTYAGKTTFTIQRRKILFQLDERFNERPVVPKFP